MFCYLQNEDYKSAIYKTNDEILHLCSVPAILKATW